jgi:hypothetical protein
MNEEAIFWDKLTAISSAVLAVTGVVAILFAHRQINEARDEARIAHLQEMIQKFSEPPVADSLRLLALKRIDQKRKVLNPLDPNDAPDEMYEVLTFFETLGLLANRGYLNKKDVWNEFGYEIFNFYADARPVIDNDRKDDKTMWSNFTQLVNDIRQIEIEEAGGKMDHPSPDDLYSFHLDESKAPPGAPISQGRGAKGKQNK